MTKNILKSFFEQLAYQPRILEALRFAESRVEKPKLADKAVRELHFTATKPRLKTVKLSYLFSETISLQPIARASGDDAEEQGEIADGALSFLHGSQH